MKCSVTMDPATASRLLYSTVFVLILEASQGAFFEEKVLEHITEDYNPNARPVSDPRKAVAVTIELSLRQIIQLDERNELLKTNIWLRMYWEDEHLVWDESQFGGVHSIRISPAHIWKPDIILSNEVSEQQQDLDLYPAIVTSNGSVAWLTKRIYTTTCSLNVADFPWDTQRCNLSYASWTYDITEIDLNSTSAMADTSVFTPNGQWILKGVPVSQKLTHFPCCNEPFSTIDFALIISRKPLYYLVNLVVPCMFITLAGVMVFCLPLDSGEKVSLSVTVLLSSTVFLLILSDVLPTQSDVVPQAGQFFMAVIIFMSLSTISTVIVLNINGQGRYGVKVPGIIRRVFIDRLGKVAMRTARNSLTGRDPGPSKSDMKGLSLTRKPSIGKSSNKSRTSNVQQYSVFSPLFRAEESLSSWQSQPKKEPLMCCLPERPVTPTYLESLLEKLVQNMERSKSQDEAKKEQDKVEGEWMYLALVLDRVFLFAFLLAIVMAGIGFMWSGATSE